MPFVVFVFCVQSQAAVWALKRMRPFLLSLRMRMIREHRFLPPLEGIFFCPYCSHSLEKGLTNQNPLSAHIFIDLRGPRPKSFFLSRQAISNFSFCHLAGRTAKFLVADSRVFRRKTHLFEMENRKKKY